MDHSLFAELLNNYVKDGVVEYQSFKNEEAKLNPYLKVLEEIWTERLPRTEQFALYINAYIPERCFQSAFSLGNRKVDLYLFYIRFINIEFKIIKLIVNC